MKIPAEVLFWIIALIVFIVVEAVTVGLASIWFALGALAALICALFHAPSWLQVLWFLVVSLITLIVTRPLAKKYINGRAVATNADRNIGRTAMVTEKIDNLAETGAVRLDGLIWTARSLDDGAVIPEGSQVIIREIRGVRVYVEEKK